MSVFPDCIISVKIVLADNDYTVGDMYDVTKNILNAWEMTDAYI